MTPPLSISTVPQPLVTVVTPVFNEQAVLPELFARLAALFDANPDVAWRAVLVDDGSRDRTVELIRQQTERDERFELVELSRNFGFQIAVTAGLDVAQGDAIILMDADLQDPPEVIPQMIAQWHAGYDVVYGVRGEREGETWFKKASASAFYRVIRRITSVNIPLDTGDFRLMDRRVVESIRKMPERHRFLRGLVSWVGFKQTGVVYQRQARFAGKTSFTLGKMLRFAMDAITGFSYFPLQIASWLGFVMAIISALSIVAVVALRLFGTDAPLLGQATTLIAVLFLGSIQLICLGIIGEYLGRMYDEVKQRPLYLVQETWGVER